jgi:hypothetical protein
MIIPRPNFGSPSKRFDPSSKTTDGIRGHPSSRPGIRDSRKEGGVFEPAIFELEVIGLRHVSGNSEDEWNMVRSGPEAGVEGGIGEGRVERGVDEHAIKASKDGSGALVGPGVETVRRGSSIQARALMVELNLEARTWLKLSLFFSFSDLVRLKSPTMTQLTEE